MIRPNWFRLWAFFAFLADLLVLIAGGVSANPFLAWAGLAGLSGQGLTALVGNHARPYTRFILLSSSFAMTGSGLNMFGVNDAIHPGQIFFGLICGAAITLLFWPVRIVLFGTQLPNAKIASALFFLTTLSLLGDGIFQSGWLIVSAAASFVLSDICCYLIPPAKQAVPSEA